MPDAPNTAPLFTRHPLRKGFYVSTANTNRDGTGAIVTVVTPRDNGCRVDWIGFKAAVTTTAGMIRVYVSDAAATWRLIGEVNTSAATVSGTVQSWSGTWLPPGGYLTLEPGQLLAVSTHNAEGVVCFPEGGHF